MGDFIIDHPLAFTIITAVLIIAIVLFISSIPAMHVEYYTIEVTKTEITGDGDYMVFGKDTTNNTIRTFTLNDSFWHGNWDTADDYASLEIGQTYTFKTTGWRIPFLSAFPNIIKIAKV
jgi:hypothetical protein